ncbi:MAG: NFACT RNA binding domain-containing protein [Planctomycetota bacterium]
MNLSAVELAWLCDQLHDRVVGAAIQKVQQPSPTRFVLSLFKSGVGKTRLFFDLDARALRFHPTQQGLPNPPDAPTLCRSLRKLLENGRVRSLEADGKDRIVVMAIDKMEAGEVQQKRLLIEFIPTRPVLFVLDPKGIIEAASSGLHSEKRDLRRGLPYSPPPPPEFKPNLDRPPFSRFEDREPSAILAALDEELFPKPVDGSDRASITRALTKALKRQVKRVSKIEQDWRRSEGGEELRQHGELLKGAMHEITRGMESIRVRDWSAPEGSEVWVDIALDSKLSAQENIANIFARAKKKIRGQEVVSERLEEQRARLAALNDLEIKLGSAERDDLPEFLKALRVLDVKVEAPAQAGKKKKPVVQARKPYKTYQSKDGLDIWVGRGARDNDELTFRCARGNEWWLHAQDYAGSHVVVKTEGELPEQSLLDAATLAVLYSKAGKAGRQAVSYTRRKNVQKFRGAAPGKVILQSHRTLMVRLEPDRISRLEGQKP